MNQENPNQAAKSENLTKEELKSAVGGNRRNVKLPNGFTVSKVRGKNQPNIQDPPRKPTRI